MLSVGSVNSQVNFSGSKKPSKKEVHSNKPKFSELGGRTFSEKYSKDGKPVNVTTANAGILFKDYILDHVIEFTVAGVTFVGVALKGKKLMSGVTGSFVDAINKKNTETADKIGVMKKFANYITTVKDNIKAAKGMEAKNIADGLQEVVKENSVKTIKEGSVIAKLVEQADDEASFMAKVTEGMKKKHPELKDVKNSDVASEFFSKKLGITRGADIVDNAVALGAAGVAAGVAKEGTDKGTDLNDQAVTDKAILANRNLERTRKAANVVLQAL